MMRLSEFLEKYIFKEIYEKKKVKNKGDTNDRKRKS